MISEDIADRYAEALIELGNEEGILEKISKDVKKIQEIISSSNDLKVFLKHPLVPEEDKKGMIKKIFEERITKEMVNFLSLLVDSSREIYLEMICARFLDKKRDEQNLTQVKVYSALEEDKGELKDLIKERLEEALGTSIEITKVKKDENLIGGIKLEIGGKVIDGSAKRQLGNLREHLTLGGIDG